MNSFNNYNNSIISLEEDNSNSQNKKEKKRNIRNQNIDTYSDSFFSKIIKSVSKIGQGLKNIMSMKINIEDNDNNNNNYNNQQFYEQISNRFNTHEEINLIDAPSFMEDSYSNSKYIKTFRNKIENDIENGDGNESKMAISHNESKRDNNDINISNQIILNKEEQIKTDLLKSNEDKNDIKSILLSKKRERGQNLNIFEEEKNESKDDDDKLDEENIEKEIKNTNIIKQKKSEKQKSINSHSNTITITNRNNISEQKNRINTSLMSLSMKSLDNIKDEINQRREENLRSIEEMHKRHGLYYDYLKEGQIREKILEEYYKDKAKRIEEVELQMKREKLKREEEFKKLKIRKASGLKFSSISKKPTILSQTKSSEIHFSGKPITPNMNLKINENNTNTNTLNVTFGNGNNSSGEQNNQSNENKSDININNTTKKENLNLSLFNKNSTMSLMSNDINNFSEIKKNENEVSTKKFDNKSTSIFGNLIGDNKKNNDNTTQEKKDENKTENKPSLFGMPVNFGTSQDLFSSTINNQSKQEDKQNLNEKGNEQKTVTQSLFTTTNIQGNQNNIFSTNNNDKSKSIFFESNSNILNIKKTENKNEMGLFGIKKEEGGLFNQNTTVSQSINTHNLFTSNQPMEKKENQSQSLATKENPFLQNTNIFGNNKQNNDNNQNKQQTQSLFGNTGGNLSLFGASSSKGLFG